MIIMEEEIKRGIRIFLFNLNDKLFLHDICEIIGENYISDIEVWHCMDCDFHYDTARYIETEDMENIMELYRTYDFSDKVTVITDNGIYGNLFNYMNTGVLTKREMIEALLYKTVK